MTEPHKNSAGRRWAEEGRVAGKASRIILHFRTAYKWGRKVILWCRESDEKNKGHLTDQFLELWDACVRLGAEVVGVIFDVFYERDMPLSTNTGVALWATGYLHRYGFTQEDMARVVVRARRNALKNPNAT